MTATQLALPTTLSDAEIERLHALFERRRDLYARSKWVWVQDEDGSAYEVRNPYWEGEK